MEKQKVIVAGGGIGGLAAALALARTGRRVQVLEKKTEFGEIGYGIQLGPNAYRVLEHLGVAAQCEARAFFPANLKLLDAVSGKELTRIALDTAFRARYGHPYIVIHRSDLHGILLEACRERDEITLETSKGVTRISEPGDRVRVTCEDGAEYEGDALVGCDGLHSAVRKDVIGDGAPRVAGHVVYRGLVPIDQVHDQRHADSVIVWVGPNMHLVQYRLRGGMVMNNVAVIESQRFRQGHADFGGPDELEAQFAVAVPEVRDLLRFVDKGRNWILNDRDPVANWTRGRVTLLGDAAHPTLQYLAQGACMALEDAAVLAARMQDCSDIHEAFLAYQQQRYVHTARVQLTSRFFGAVCHAQDGARDVRNSLLSQRPPNTYTEVDWLYRGIRL